MRFRLTVAYSSLLFLLAALVIGAIYWGVSRRVADDPVTQTYVVQGTVRLPDGRLARLSSAELADVRSIEQAAGVQTLEALRAYSLATLLALFAASLLLGWWLSGRALRPVRAITAAAEDIRATDLSRRIALAGPDDDLRRLADTIDAMLARLDEAFAAQRQIVDDASHELRNPLAIIRTNVDAVLARDDVTPAEREHAAAVVARATDRMGRLVDDLLATARRAGPAFLSGDVDLGGVAREAVEELRTLGAPVRLRTGLADGVVVVGDHDALRRAVGNLLSNAVRLSPPGGEVLVASGRVGDWGWVAVRDRGPGIAPEDQRRIFDRFFRAGEHRSAHGGHAGLGLAIVRQIVDSHGGSVAVHSAPSAGATFVLWLPVAGTPGAAGDGLPAPVDVDPLPAG